MAFLSHNKMSKQNMLE